MKMSEPFNKFNKIDFKYSVSKGFISVIIPVYKDVKGLEDTLKSLRKQTLHTNLFEIIVANDGADKEISNLCNSYNVKEIKISPNGGSYKARNKALEVSRGEFLAFTDADVVVPEDWLKNGAKLLNNYDYIAGNINYIPQKKTTTTIKYLKLWEFNLKEMFMKDHYGVTANMFTTRKIIVEVGGFDSRLQSGGDNEFGNRIYNFSKNKQIFDSNYVLHPCRNFEEIIKKKKRIIKGTNDLVNYFPNRYKDYKYILLDDIIYSFLPPVHLWHDKELFFYFWYMKLIDLFFHIKYRNQHMQIFNENSIFLKIKRMILQEKIPTNIPNP